MLYRVTRGCGTLVESHNSSAISFSPKIRKKKMNESDRVLDGIDKKIAKSRLSLRERFAFNGSNKKPSATTVSNVNSIDPGSNADQVLSVAPEASAVPDIDTLVAISESRKSESLAPVPPAMLPSDLPSVSQRSFFGESRSELLAETNQNTEEHALTECKKFVPIHQ